MSLARDLEERPALPRGPGERFRGYGVMGVSFASGHILALRRMVATSVGPPYTAVWHRDPYRRWSMYVDVDPGSGCPRYFGEALSRVEEEAIELNWRGPCYLCIRVPGAALEWGVRMRPGGLPRLLSVMGGWVPSSLLRRRGVLDGVGLMAGSVLRLGRLALRGRAPNGQDYAAVPRLLWGIEASTAVLDGQELGPLGTHPRQARLGEFWIPRRNLFALGEAFFEELDPARHSRAHVSPDEAATPQKQDS